MKKTAIVMLLAGFCFGATATMLITLDSLNEATASIAEERLKAIQAESKIKQLEYQLLITKNDLAEAIESIPLNTHACWVKESR